MLVYRCDRCGCHYENNVNRRNKVLDRQRNPIDLCPECQSSLERWIDTYKHDARDLAWDMFVSMMGGSSQLNNLVAAYLPRLYECGIVPDESELREYTDFEHYEDTYRKVKRMIENGEL